MRVNVDKYSLSPQMIEAGTRGSYGMDEIEFVFSSDWDGMLICVYFFPPRSAPVTVLYNSPFQIPPEVMRISGKHQYVIAGYIGDKRLISVTGYVNVIHTVDALHAGGKATPSQAEQLIQLASEAKDAADEIVRRANSGEFSGEKGEAGKQGVKGEIGDAGKSIEFIWNGTMLGVRQSGDTDYIFSDLRGLTGEQGIKGETGDIGKSIEFVWNGTQLGIRVESDTEYKYVDLKGEKGDKGETGDRGDRGDRGEAGKSFLIKGYYQTLEILKTKELSPEAGDTYGVGISAPYDIYVYDAISGDWLNNGAIQGAKGDTGEIGDTGPKGDTGVSSYLHIRYGMSDTPEPLLTSPADYIGLCVTSFPDAPEHYSAYEWNKIKGEIGDRGEKGETGERGIQGEKGEQGEKGDKGETGDQGIQGEKGDTGEAGKDAVIFYGVCETEADVSDKIVDIQGFSADKLVAGTLVAVKMIHANTATSPTLNVSNTKASPMQYKDDAVTGDMMPAGTIALLEFDGLVWQIVNPTGGSSGTLKELVRFTSTGTFDPADYPSIGDVYIAFLLGGGGGGGYCYGDFKEGFAASAGGFLNTPPVIITDIETVVIGAGGKGATSSTGSRGGDTTVFGFTAKGGSGSSTRNVTDTYSDPVERQTYMEGCILGNLGNEFTDDVFDSRGLGENGADSIMGTGGITPTTPDMNGGDASGYGAGGGMGTRDASTISGGAGSNGIVIIYGYQ